MSIICSLVIFCRPMSVQAPQPNCNCLRIFNTFMAIIMRKYMYLLPWQMRYESYHSGRTTEVDIPPWKPQVGVIPPLPLPPEYTSACKYIRGFNFLAQFFLLRCLVFNGRIFFANNWLGLNTNKTIDLDFQSKWKRLQDVYL